MMLNKGEIGALSSRPPEAHILLPLSCISIRSLFLLKDLRGGATWAYVCTSWLLQDIRYSLIMDDQTKFQGW